MDQASLDHDALMEELALLREQHDQLEIVLKATREGLCDWHIDTGALYLSQSWYDMLGYERRDLPEGIDVFETVCHPDDYETAAALLAAHVNGTADEPYYIEHRFRNKAGEWRWVRACGEVIGRDDQGRGIRMIGTMQDVTDSRRAREELRASNERLTNMLESISDGFFSLAEDFTITYFNKAAAELLSRDRSEVEGCSLWEAFPEICGTVFEQKYREAMESRKFTAFETHFDAPRYTNWYEVRVYPYDEGISVYFRVTTEQHKALRALRESERRYRTLAENFPDGALFLLDRDLRIVFVDGKGLSVAGLKREALTGKTLREVFPPEVHEVAEKHCRALFKAGEPVYYTVKLGERTYENRGVPVRDGGQITEAVVFTQDITDRLRAEEEKRTLEAQIQHAQKLESLGVLAGGIAHDFNNLLMAILGNADLAAQDLSPSSPARANVQEIEKASRRAAELCKQMLAYSGKGKFVSIPLDLNELVQEMTHLLDVSISKKAVLRLNFAHTLPAIQADPAQMRQIIMNLITNASDAIGDTSGVIMVSTGIMECDREYLSETFFDEGLEEGLYVTLEVADTGSGMDATTKARIFDPFFTTKFTGRGLGLAAVLGIVRGHKGALKVYSEPGKGTTFKLLLPAASDPAVPQGAPNVTLPGWQGTGTILLVDDEETIRTLGKRMLQRLGFEVLTATDGRDALAKLRAHDGDLACVILDLTMPHMDGEEAFREIRRQRCDLPVILSSGYNEQEISQRFAGKNLAAFIQKPYQFDTLRTTLRQVLG